MVAAPTLSKKATNASTNTKEEGGHKEMESYLRPLTYDISSSASHS